MVVQMLHWFVVLDNESVSMHITVFGIGLVVAVVAGGIELGVKLVRTVSAGDTGSTGSGHYAVICLGSSCPPPGANVIGGWPVSFWWR